MRRLKMEYEMILLLATAMISIGALIFTIYRTKNNIKKSIHDNHKDDLVRKVNEELTQIYNDSLSINKNMDFYLKEYTAHEMKDKLVVSNSDYSFVELLHKGSIGVEELS